MTRKKKKVHRRKRMGPLDPGFAVDMVKSTEDCAEYAVIDAYGDCEQITAWMTCMQEVFEGVKKVRVFGEEVELLEIDLEGEFCVVARCRKGNSEASVAITSVEFIKPTRVQKLWLEAWQERSGFDG